MPADLPRIAGIYNVVWATGSAFAYLTGGALMDRLGSEALVFWVPAGLHLTQLAVIAGASRTEGTSAANAEAAPREVQGEMAPDFNPRPIAKGRVFLTLAWIANPFAYVAIYGILPVIPKLAERLGLNA